MSSSESRSAPAATLSMRWSVLPVPGMTSTCGPCRNVQASRTCAGVALCVGEGADREHESVLDGQPTGEVVDPSPLFGCFAEQVGKATTGASPRTPHSRWAASADGIVPGSSEVSMPGSVRRLDGRRCGMVA
jgi:hypothetical protein